MASQPGYLPFEDLTSEEHQKRLAAARRAALRRLMLSVPDADVLVFLASELDLDAELDELAATSPERQRALELARARLDEELPRLV